MPVKQLMPN